MKIEQFIWLDYFVEKLARKHSVTPDEVEEMFNNRPRIQFAERGDVAEEDLYRALGKTDNGRYLIAFFIYKGDGQALVVSARDMSDRERKSYGKHKR